ncbi:hypothetical protein F3Y22_tig00111105pilonHSYRG00576 [Hibiscus syriacus]|uniref:C3H1-type domain-containing protein n=1 Tax=Hibiscus syriacus TaxID=106335 RepID=A0A6A2Z1A5_HIBSY|nr:hypothetical protein F3Y22_tig00111105pilonHSYRG00576 [Hibiscus syriacus]
MVCPNPVRYDVVPLKEDGDTGTMIGLHESTNVAVIELFVEVHNISDVMGLSRNVIGNSSQMAFGIGGASASTKYGARSIHTNSGKDEETEEPILAGDDNVCGGGAPDLTINKVLASYQSTPHMYKIDYDVMRALESQNMSYLTPYYMSPTRKPYMRSVLIMVHSASGRSKCPKFNGTMLRSSQVIIPTRFLDLERGYQYTMKHGDDKGVPFQVPDTFPAWEQYGDNWGTYRRCATVAGLDLASMANPTGGYVDSLLHRRSFSVSGLCLGAEDLNSGLGFQPCLYFARGFCKNGSSCRFIYGDHCVESATNMTELEQCQELLRLKYLQQQQQKLAASSSPFLPDGASFPYNKCVTFLLQQQQNETHR